MQIRRQRNQKRVVLGLAIALALYLGIGTILEQAISR